MNSILLSNDRARVCNIKSKQDLSKLNFSLDTKYDEQRTIGIGAQILKDIGVKQMALMSAPKIYHGISAIGLDVIKYVRK